MKVLKVGLDLVENSGIFYRLQWEAVEAKDGRLGRLDAKTEGSEGCEVLRRCENKPVRILGVNVTAKGHRFEGR